MIHQPKPSNRLAGIAAQRATLLAKCLELQERKDRSRLASSRKQVKQINLLTSYDHFHGHPSTLR